MKITTIALTTALALSSTFALAQAGAGSGSTLPEKSGAAVNGGGGVVGETGKPSNDAAMQKNMGTTGSGRADPNGGNPNGTAGGPTSLSGTGSSQYGGNGTAGTTNGR